MKVLVTGGSGRLGRWLVPELFKEGHEVTVCDLVAPKGVYHFLHIDMLNLGELDWALSGIDTVVHLAAIPNIFHDSPERVFYFNTQGMYNILEAAVRNKVKRVIVASSDSAIGFGFAERPFHPDYLPVDEDHPRYPQDPYSLSKAFSEDLCAAFTRRSGIQTICLRPCWIWLPDEDLEDKEAVDHPERYWKGLWGYVDVRDAARAFCLAVAAPELPAHSVCYVSAPDVLAREETLTLLDRFHPDVTRIDRSRLSGYKSVIDGSRAEKLLGFTPQHSWHDYIK
jgi:nucleoside-diphosphate-sugar epimerase